MTEFIMTILILLNILVIYLFSHDVFFAVVFGTLLLIIESLLFLFGWFLFDTFRQAKKELDEEFKNFKEVKI